jgi:myo-inositol 2-dehydrogenase / D-chiro-inositol 1-dehydrogenase
MKMKQTGSTSSRRSAPLQHPLRLALIGCGEVTRAKHLPALARIRTASIVALCDLDEKRSRQVAGQFGVARHCTDAGEIFAMPDVDAVGVCTDPGSHADLAIAAIRAGKHVLVEKPLALTPPDCIRMMAESEGAGVIAMTGFHMRFHRLVRQARDYIRQGSLGPIESVRIVWHSPRSDQGIPEWKTRRGQGGGALVEIAVHHFDLMRFLLDTEFEEIYAMNRDGTRHDEAAVIAARMANQTLVTGEFSERSAHEIEIVVSGERGWLRLDCERFDGLEIRGTGEPPGAPAVRLRSISRFLQNLLYGLKTLQRGGDYRISYENEWKHFAECVRTGAPPESTFHDGLRSVEAVCAALHSTATSRPVHVSRVEELQEG